MKREHMPFQYMGQFKAVAADYEFYLSLSNEPRSICLTERQMYILSVWNTYTPWMTRWYNTEDTSSAELAAIAAEIEDLLMCGCGVPEPSITDRFNTTTYISNTSTSYEETYNTWNTGGQTVVSIAPDLDYGTGDPENIDKLLCLALDMLIRAIVETAIANKRGQDQPNRDMVKNIGGALGGLSAAGGAAIAAGGAAAGFVAFLGGPYLVLGLALAAVGMAVANLLWTTDISVFQDAVAIQRVICTVSNNLVGNEPTRSAFQGALSPNSFPAGSNAAKLAEIIQPFLDDLDTYLQWLATAQGLYEVANFGILPECACDPERIPVINSVWDEFNYGGILTGPDENGFYTATTSLRGSGVGYGFSLMDVDGRTFVLTDITYDSPPQCQVFVLDAEPFYIACTNTNVYAGQTCTEFHTTQESAVATSMQFKMVAAV